MITVKISDFSNYPSGRYRTDGKHSAEAFRDDILIPALKTGERVTVNFNGVMGYSSAWIDEVFSGLITAGFSLVDLKRQMHLESEFDVYAIQAWRYMGEENFDFYYDKKYPNIKKNKEPKPWSWPPILFGFSVGCFWSLFWVILLGGS